jgi:hypothetical protein
VDVAAFFFGLLRAAELDERFAASGLGRDAASIFS